MPITPGITIAIRDEGLTQGSVHTVDFVGAGVSAAVASGVATVTVSGGGGGGFTGTPGSVIFLGGAGSETEDNTNLFYNDGTNTLQLANLTVGPGATGVEALTADGITANSVTTDALTIGSFTTGSIPYIGAAGVVSETNTRLFWDAASQCLCVGGNTPIGVESVNLTKEGAQLYLGMVDYFDGAASATFIAAKARGSISAPRRAQSGDQLFIVAAFGAYAADDATNATVIGGTSARFTLNTTEAHTATAKGTSFVVTLTPNGSTTLADVATFTGTGGTVQFNSYVVGTARFSATGLISSGIAIAALAPTLDDTIPASYSAVVPRKLLIASGKKITLGLGAILRIL